MRVKIQGGTSPAGGEALCTTCRYATVIKGTDLDHHIIECDRLSYGHNRITFPVTFCTAYSDRRQPSIRDMEEVAWVLRTDPRRHQIGFVRSADLKPRERWVLDDDGE